MLQAAQLLQLTTVAMLGLALVMVRSAGMSIGGGRGLDPTSFLTSRHTVYATLAIGAMLLTSRLPLRRALKLRPWFNPLVWLAAMAVGLLLAQAIPGVGRTVNGATRWIELGNGSFRLTFQPSELAKWAVVLWIPFWIVSHGGRIRGLFDRSFLVPLLGLAVFGGLIIGEDLGTAVLILSVGVVLLLAAGAKVWHLVLLVPPAALAVVMVILNSPFRRARLTAFLDPWANPEGIGYHPIQSMLAIAQGGLTGRGIGNGVQKFGYLPEDTTDFLFSIICEETGIAGASLVVVCYLVILGVGFGILRRCRDAFGRLVALGILLMLGTQALINLAVVTVVVPTKGIALPLLSAGGTGWVMTAAAIGLLASLDTADHGPMFAAADVPEGGLPVDAAVSA